eukprot:3147909-Rhodomonas_salina.2
MTGTDLAYGANNSVYFKLADGSEKVGSPMCLRARYAVCGTERAYSAAEHCEVKDKKPTSPYTLSCRPSVSSAPTVRPTVMCGTDLACSAIYCAVLTSCVELTCYARAMPCPVLP